MALTAVWFIAPVRLGHENGAMNRAATKRAMPTNRVDDVVPSWKGDAE